jgi:two-component system response regulator DctR
MRGMSGVELLEELRRRNYTLSVLVMTAYPDTRSTVRAMRGGAVNLIEKPCNPQELWDAIQLGLREDAQRFQQEQIQHDIEARMQSLSSGEMDVLKLLTEGNANKVIASHLEVSLRTVEARRAAIFEKLGVDSVAELMRLWLSYQSHKVP